MNILQEDESGRDIESVESGRRHWGGGTVTVTSMDIQIPPTTKHVDTGELDIKESPPRYDQY